MAKQFNIFGDIVGNESDRWFESDVPASTFVGWLAKQEGDIAVNINSNGGDVAGGLAIANAIKGYNRGDVSCNVLGVAASMASVVACAGKRLCMGQGAFLMVHNPWTVTMGNAEDLRKDAETLDKMRDSILGFYQSKCPGKTADDFKELMDAETWISEKAAKEYGFEVGEYVGDLKAAAALTRRALGNAPDSVKALLNFRSSREASESARGDAEARSDTPATPTNTETASEETGDTNVLRDSGAPRENGGGNWEARFKGLSAKFNDLQRRATASLADAERDYKEKIGARDTENASLKSQLDQSAKDLASANAKISELSAKLEESANALQAANADLGATRDSLQKAEDKAAELEKSRDLLTAGVLTPAPEAAYAEKMKAAKTPEEREALRAQKRAGKIH